MSARRTCPVVGLVGGVGSGKSAVARRAAERYGFAVFDADRAGHRALSEPAVKDQIRNRFGDGVFDPTDAVDRSALARRVFGTAPEHSKAKAELEAITHPVIRRDFEHALAEAGDAPALLLDAAVLLETGWREACDAVIFIDVPRSVRRERVAARGWSEAEWARREAAQLPLDEKRRSCDAVVDNAGPLDAAAQELAATIERLCHVRLPAPVALAAAST